MIDFSQCEEKIGVTFADKNILMQAFTHRSYINENPNSGLSHNERLEFLGDAVLELIITDELFRRFPTKAEGDLTAYRSALVNAVTLSDIALGIGMNDFLLLSKGEAKDNGKARQYILANTFEAVIGAIYMDQGYKIAETFIHRFLLPKLDDILKNKSWRDAKSFVQEKAQEFVGTTPAYKVLSESGPDHDKQFTIGIYFGDEFVTQGKGKSKQEAEQQAASHALELKKWMD